jgi:hypothetical protein
MCMTAAARYEGRQTTLFIVNRWPREAVGHPGFDAPRHFSGQHVDTSGRWACRQ